MHPENSVAARERFVIDNYMDVNKHDEERNDRGDGSLCIGDLVCLHWSSWYQHPCGTFMPAFMLSVSSASPIIILASLECMILRENGEGSMSCIQYEIITQSNPIGKCSHLNSRSLTIDPTNTSFALLSIRLFQNRGVAKQVWRNVGRNMHMAAVVSLGSHIGMV